MSTRCFELEHYQEPVFPDRVTDPKGRSWQIRIGDLHTYDPSGNGFVDEDWSRLLAVCDEPRWAGQMIFPKDIDLDNPRKREHLLDCLWSSDSFREMPDG